MTREESKDALNLILTGIPSEAQIGAFMIAHRMKRPEPEELAGMIDSYLELGPKIYSNKTIKAPICFGMPFDGRDRTAPIYPITTLVLLSAEQPVILNGGQRMPVKYGVTSKELFYSLKLNLKGLKINEVISCIEENQFGFIYQPDHFKLAEKLIYYRKEIGKRPPIASMELLWNTFQGENLFCSGFVHSPTEKRHQTTLKILGKNNFILIKGLEGGVDLSTSKTNQIKIYQNDNCRELNLNARDFNINRKDENFLNIETWAMDAFSTLEYNGPLLNSLLFNSGFYLYATGNSDSIKSGIEYAKYLIINGKVKSVLKKLRSWRKRLN